MSGREAPREASEAPMRLCAMLSVATAALIAGCVEQRPIPPTTAEKARPPVEAEAAPQPKRPAAEQVADGTARSSDGVPIHYHAEGNGEPALVFVHGWSCNGGYWNSQVPYFTKRYRVVTLDLAGHGSSGLGRKRYTIEAYADDVKAVVEKLGLRRVVLIGHSMAGSIIVEAALELPGRVVGLVPVDALQDLSEKPDPGAYEELLRELHSDFRATTVFFARNLFPEHADPSLVERVANDMASEPPDVAIPTMEAISRYDVRPALTRLTVPIHCINGDKWPTEVQGSRQVYPRYDAAVLPGVGDFPMLEAPQVFNEKLAEVLRDLGK